MLNRLAWIVLFLIACFTAIFGYYASIIKFDYDIEKFYPVDDPDTEFFNEFRKKYSSDNDFLFVGIEEKNSIFNDASILELKQFSKELSEASNIERVNSIFSLPGDFINDSIKDYKSDSIRIFNFRELTQPFIDNDSRRLCFVLLHKQFLSKEGCDKLVQDVNSILSKYNFNEVHLAGRSVAQDYYIKTSEKELRLFLSIGIVVLVIVLIITFRTLWGVLVPLAVVLLSMVWTVGLMSWLGQPLNLLLTILPTIIFIVGISDVIHIISKYLDLLRDGEEKNGAIKKAFKEVGLATFLTSLTTAVGFLTMLLSNIEPIRHFGLYTAMGVMLAYILAFSFLPAILILSKRPENKAVHIGGKFWKTFLSRLLYLILKWKKTVAFSAIVLAVVSIIGIFNIKVNSFILEDVENDNPMRLSFNWFADNFSGIRPFEMEVTVNDTTKSFFSQDVVKELDKLENYLTQVYGVTSIISSNTVLKIANFSTSFNEDESYVLPKSKRKLKQLEKEIKKHSEGKVLFSDDFKKSRLSGRAKDLGSVVYFEKNDQLNKFINDQIDSKLIAVRLTGSAELIDKNIKSLSYNLMGGLIIAFIVIIIIVGIVFKSLRMIVIALIPNILPLLLIGGIIGFFGIDMKISTSIIFTIAFGIAVDDTLHFLNKLKIELSKGKPLAIAVRRTFISTGKAVILTTIVLCAGYISLVGSSFLGTFYIGLLVSITLFLAVICDLFLLPILILKFYKK